MRKLWVLPALMATTAVAGSGQTGLATGVVTGFISGDPSGTAIFVFTTATWSTWASCNTTQRFVLSSTDPKYKDAVATILEAHATGTPVTAIGSGSCNALSNAEDLNYVCVGAIPC
jgi:hypothetical protein